MLFLFWFGLIVMLFYLPVCRSLNSAGDLLLFAAESCITQRYVGTIQRPILFLPPDISLEGCWDPDAETLNNTTVVTNNLTKNGLENVSNNIIPLNIRGYKPAEIIPGLAGQGFHFGNVLLVHVCDYDGYCGMLSENYVISMYSLFIWSIIINCDQLWS